MIESFKGTSVPGALLCWIFLVSNSNRHQFTCHAETDRKENSSHGFKTEKSSCWPALNNLHSPRNPVYAVICMWSMLQTITVHFQSKFTHKVTLEGLFLSNICSSSPNAIIIWANADLRSLTGFSQLIQREAIDRQVTLETLAIYPGGQAAVFILWNTTWSCCY